MYKGSIEDTIVAISTPIGEGGIGIVRLSGTRALEISDEMFVSRDGGKTSGYQTYTVHYGHIARPDGDIVDEVILTVMRGPKSYTKEDVIEINCHGGIQAAKEILGLAMERGARLSEPGEFTKRAFLNGRIDLAQAEAVLDIIRAKTEGSAKVAMSQLDGGLSKEVNGLRDELIVIASEVEAGIDFPDEKLEVIGEGVLVEKSEKVLAGLKKLIATFDGGVVLREGVLAVICGKPNVGKSSLMNLLLRRDRVIVTPVPGTTRDAVEEMINLKGLPMRLVDTAGISETMDMVEKEGVARSQKYLELADLVLLMLDGSAKIDRKDLNIMKLVDDKKKLVIINKSDLVRKIAVEKVKEIFKNDRIIEISVKEKDTIELLESAIAEMVSSGGFVQGEGAGVANARHKELLGKALANMFSVKKALNDCLSPELIAIDLREAISNLGPIIGKSVSDDILDRIFEQFCIGK